MAKILPELKALTAAYDALEPLKPEARRKVIEALHALLQISAGESHPKSGPPRAAKSRKRS